MTRSNKRNVGASVRQRLLNRAKEEGRVFQELAHLYAMERVLFRLGQSSHADAFILKGGLMTLTWAREYARVTRDIDLLGRGVNAVDEVVTRIVSVLGTDTPDDGLVFDLATVAGEQITVATAYVGVRVRFTANLSGMVIRMQVDVGFGDAVSPEPTWVDYPQLLDLGAPRLLGYPPEATVAEKLHAICVLGLANSRLKDYYDLWTACRLSVCNSQQLALAVRTTFERRGTEVPTNLPEGLDVGFALAPNKGLQWAAFLRKSGLEAPRLDAVVDELGAFAMAAFRDASGPWPDSRYKSRSMP